VECCPLSGRGYDVSSVTSYVVWSGEKKGERSGAVGIGTVGQGKEWRHSGEIQGQKLEGESKLAVTLERRKKQIPSPKEAGRPWGVVEGEQNPGHPLCN